LARREDDALTEVRSAALAAVRTMMHDASAVTVLASEEMDADEQAGGSLRRYGLTVRAGGPADLLGLGHTIGAWLLDAVGWTGPRRYVDRIGGDERSVLVVADGCGCVDETSPRGFDPRGAKLQDRLVEALAVADARRLADLDSSSALDLWCTGAPALRQAGAAAVGRRIEAALLYAGAPLGVGYWVVDWRLR